MAIDKGTTFGNPTITRVPTNDYSTEVLSAYEPIIFECSYSASLNRAISGQRITAEVFYEGVSLGTLNKSSILVSGNPRFRFNVSEMLQTALSSEVQTVLNTTNTIQTGSSYVAGNFYVIFTGYFITSVGNALEDGTVTSQTYTVANTILQPDVTTRTLAQYTMLGTGTPNSRYFLSKSPANKVLRYGEVEQLFFLWTNSYTAELEYQTYDLSGSANASVKLTPVTILNNNGYMPFSVGGILSAWTSISKVDIWLNQSSGSTRVSEKRTYKISQESTCSTDVRLMWRNSLGGFDFFTFRDSYTKEYQVERINYMKPLSDTIAVIDRQGKTLKNKGAHIYSVSSGFYPKEYLEMFEDLLDSNDVYWVQYTAGYWTNKMLPIVITSNDMVIDDKEGVVKMGVEFTMSRPKKTHND